MGLFNWAPVDLSLIQQAIFPALKKNKLKKKKIKVAGKAYKSGLPKTGLEVFSFDAHCRSACPAWPEPLLTVKYPFLFHVYYSHLTPIYN